MRAGLPGEQSTTTSRLPPRCMVQQARTRMPKCEASSASCAANATPRYPQSAGAMASPPSVAVVNHSSPNPQVPVMHNHARSSLTATHAREDITGGTRRHVWLRTGRAHGEETRRGAARFKITRPRRARDDARADDSSLVRAARSPPPVILNKAVCRPCVSRCRARGQSPGVTRLLPCVSLWSCSVCAHVTCPHDGPLGRRGDSPNSPHPPSWGWLVFSGHLTLGFFVSTLLNP